MNITLRQAHKLVEKLTHLHNSIPLHRAASLNIWSVAITADLSPTNTPQANYSKVESAIGVAANQLASDFDRKRSAISYRAGLRSRIQAKNQSSGINDLISRRKYILDLLSVLKQVDQVARTGQELDNADALSAKITAELNSDGGRRYGQDAVAFVVPFNQDVKADIVGFEREIEEIDDKLTTKNASTSIELSPVEVEFFKKENLI